MPRDHHPWQRYVYVSVKYEDAPKDFDFVILNFPSVKMRFDLISSEVVCKVTVLCIFLVAVCSASAKFNYIFWSIVSGHPSVQEKCVNMYLMDFLYIYIQKSSYSTVCGVVSICQEGKEQTRKFVHLFVFVLFVYYLKREVCLHFSLQLILVIYKIMFEYVCT